MWITKKPVGEMAAKYDPTEYEAIHSTYEDNRVYCNDANYIANTGLMEYRKADS